MHLYGKYFMGCWGAHAIMPLPFDVFEVEVEVEVMAPAKISRVRLELASRDAK